MQHLHLPPITLDGTTDLLSVDNAEIDQFYAPLASFLLNKSSGARRFVVGIAGPPACGKSAFTALLSAVCSALAHGPVAAAVGMDGWHYPNQYLDTHTIVHQSVEIALRKLKGAPASFDTAGLMTFLQQVREQPSLAYPLYSRHLHDPVPQAARIDNQQRLVLIEGNYLLLDQPPWDALADLFDLTIFLTAPRAQLILSLRERHLRGGKASETVEQHLQFSDIPNIDLILLHSKPADISVDKSDSRHIVNITYHLKK